MPNYGKEDFKESNINYLNKDFASLKQSLMNYAKSYFPNSYRDFNEASPGMMLLEMNAYVGDVLSFYIDQQYREMLLPLAEERRNIVNLANMFGYKVKPIVPAYVDLTFSQDLDASENPAEVDYSTGGIFPSGIQVIGSDNTIVFETLDVLDFQITGSSDTKTIANTSEAGLATSYTLHREVRAVSGKQKTSQFSIGIPEKFKRITLEDKNIIDIISCIDSNGNDWYEVDYLAQDKVPISTHYTNDSDRTDAYQNLTDSERVDLPVPYSLEYIKTGKRFTRETNVDNTTSLVFGNGVLRDGQMVDDGFIDLEQVGIIIPGQSNDLASAINPLLGDEYSTLGETPNNTTLTITYRVGGGIDSNIPSGDLNEITTGGTDLGGGAVSITSLGATNNYAARGGKDEESIDEIRERTKAFFSTQNRCVTKEDYEARVMNIPAKFGNIAKVYVARNVDGDTGSDTDTSQIDTALSDFSDYATDIKGIASSVNTMAHSLINLDSDEYGTFEDLKNDLSGLEYRIRVGTADVPGGPLGLQERIDNIGGLIPSATTTFNLSAINIFVLSYNTSKQLVGNPISANDSSFTDNVPAVLTSNIKNYLNNFRILTDTVQIKDGFIINFGVFFDVVANQYADKQLIKLRCIDKIKDYFRIEKMQFNQPIFISKIEYELMGIDGVRSVNYVSLTQSKNEHSNGAVELLNEPTFTYSYSADAGPDNDLDGNPDGGYTTDGNGTTGYGFKYDFSEETGALSDGIIRPPHPDTPAVFELKNPNQNIKGRVR